MTFIVRTRMGDIDVNPKNHPLGRKELLSRARRIVKRALEVGESADVIERSGGRETPVDPVSGQYLFTGSPANVVAAGLQRRGGAGAGLHHTRTRDEATGRSRRLKHGGRAGRGFRENPERPEFVIDDSEFQFGPTGAGPAGGTSRGDRPQPGTDAWKKLPREEKERIKAEMAEELAATLQNVSVEELRSVLAAGRPVYPAVPAPSNPFGLTVYSDISDVQAAARTLGIPVTPVTDTSNPQGYIVVSSRSADMGTDPARTFRFAASDVRPMVIYLEARKQGEAGRPGSMSLFFRQLGQLAAWLRNNGINRVEITGPTQEIARTRREVELASGPTAGDVLYFLSTMLAPEEGEGRAAPPSTGIHSPVAGRVVDIQRNAKGEATTVVLEDGRNYASEFDRIVNTVNVARRAIVERRERMRGGSRSRQRAIQNEIERLTDELLPLARGIDTNIPEVRERFRAAVTKIKNAQLMQYAGALRAQGKRYEDYPIQYDNDAIAAQAAAQVSESFGRRADIYSYDPSSNAQSIIKRITELKGELFRARRGESLTTDPELERMEAEFFGRGAPDVRHIEAALPLGHPDGARMAGGQRSVAALVPALSDEANRGYPSLSAGASVAEVERAIRKLFGTPTTSVVVTLKGVAPFDSVLVAKDPTKSRELATLVAQKAERERDLASLQNQVSMLSSRDPDAVAALLRQAASVMSGDPTAVKFGEVFGEALAGAAAEPSAEQAAAAEVERSKREGSVVSAELVRLHDALKDLDREVRRLDATIDGLSTQTFRFTGRISVRIPVSLEYTRGRYLPLLPGIDIGTMVQQGQALTGPALIVQTPPRVSAGPAITQRQRPVAMSPRLTEEEAAAVVNLPAADPTRPTRNLLALSSTNLQEGQTGMFTVAVTEYEGKGKDKTVKGTKEAPIYARLVSGRTLSFPAVLEQIGGFGEFLVQFGYMPRSELDKLNPKLRTLTTQPPAPVIEKVISDVIGSRNTPMIEWVKGNRNLNILALSATPPADVMVGDVGSADVIVPTVLQPAYPAAGKPVRTDKVVKLTLYRIYQDRPTESSPVKFEKVELLRPGVRLADAIAEAVNIRSALVKKVEAMVRAVEAMPQKDREALITEADRAAAQLRASRFGTNREDIDYITNRLLRSALSEEAAKYPEILEQITKAEAARMSSLPEEQARAIKTPAVAKLVETLRRGNPEKYGSFTREEIVRSFTPDTEAVQAGIEAMREKIAQPHVTDDPMSDVLLIAEQAPDASGRKMPQFELIVDWSRLNLLRGQSGTGLARLIKAFEAAPQIGFVPSEYPKTKAERAAISTLAEARNVSSRAAIAAARLGLDFSPRGEFGVTKTSFRGQRAGLALPGGLSIEAGKEGPVKARSFGEIGSTRSAKSRRDILMSRLPREVTSSVSAPLGESKTAYQMMTERYQRAVGRVIEKGREADIPKTRQELAIERARNDAAMSALLQAASGSTDPAALAADDFFGDDTTLDFTFMGSREKVPVEAAAEEMPLGPDDPSMTLEFNPRSRRRQQVRPVRMRRNPTSVELAEAVLYLPALANDVRQSTVNQIAEWVVALKQERVPSDISGDPAAAKAINAFGLLAAVASWAMRSLQESGAAKELYAIKSVIDGVSNKEFLNGVMSGQKVTLNFGAGSVDLDSKSNERGRIIDQYRAGFLYKADSAGFLRERDSDELAELLAYGPFFSAWRVVTAATLSEVEKTAVIESSREYPVSLPSIENYSSWILGGARTAEALGGLQRILAKVGNDVKIVQPGLVLLADSKKLLAGFQPARGEAAVAGVASTAAEANAAYATLVEGILGERKLGPDALQAAARAYEDAATRLRLAISDSGSEGDEGFRSRVEARLMHFLAGRTAAGAENISKDRRLTALRGPLASYLDFYGRPLFPIPTQALSAAGVPPLDYGRLYLEGEEGPNATLASRVTLPQARTIIERTSGRAGRSPVSTSTLDCKPGVGRGIASFPRPYTDYRPESWPARGLLNVIWLSPDGQVARIYRLGAAVCAFQRKPGESLPEFLAEVAENWNLWLTDPQHVRQGRGYAKEIFIGQSGDPAGVMYRINTDADRSNLSRNTFARRAKEVGIVLSAAAPNRIGLAFAEGSPAYQTRIETGKIVKWADTADIGPDAETYMAAMVAAGLVTDEEAERRVQEILREAPSVGASQAAGAQASREGLADLVVLFPPTTIRMGGTDIPTGGTGTLPTRSIKSVGGIPSQQMDGFEDTVVEFLLNSDSPFKRARIYDRSYRGRLKSLSLELAAGKISGVQRDQAIQALRGSAAATILNDMLTRSPVTGRQFVVIAGEVSPKDRPLVPEVEKETENQFILSREASRISEAEGKKLLALAVKAEAPIMVVDVQDIEIGDLNARAADDGLAMLKELYAVLAKEGRILTTPVVYAFAGSRNAYRVDSAITQFKEAIAKGLETLPDRVPLTAVEFKDLGAKGSAALRRRAANPRQRMVRQVAAQWMRTYPFVG